MADFTELSPNQTTYSRQRSESHRPHIHRLRKISYWMDEAFEIPGTRFRVGLDGLIGLIPGFGDAAGSVISLFFVATAFQLNVPVSIILRMVGNILMESIVGLVPILGDVFDFGWKANKKNLVLIEKYFERPVATTRRSRIWVFLVFTLLLALLIGFISLIYILARALFNLAFQ